MLSMLVAAAALLSLQLWMVVTPLRGGGPAARPLLLTKQGAGYAGFGDPEGAAAGAADEAYGYGYGYGEEDEEDEWRHDGREAAWRGGAVAGAQPHHRHAAASQQHAAGSGDAARAHPKPRLQPLHGTTWQGRGSSAGGGPEGGAGDRRWGEPGASGKGAGASAAEVELAVHPGAAAPFDDDGPPVATATDGVRAPLLPGAGAAPWLPAPAPAPAPSAGPSIFRGWLPRTLLGAWFPAPAAPASTAPRLRLRLPAPAAAAGTTSEGGVPDSWDDVDESGFVLPSPSVSFSSRCEVSVYAMYMGVYMLICVCVGDQGCCR